MNLWVTEELMVSEDTAHTAHRVDDGWELSWLPGRVLDRNQAVTGMILAENVADHPVPAGRRWPLINALAAELGLTGPEAVARVALPDYPRDAELDDRPDIDSHRGQFCCTPPAGTTDVREAGS